MNNVWFDNMIENVIVIYSWISMKAFYNQTIFKSINRTIIILFSYKNQLIANDIIT